MLKFRNLAGYLNQKGLDLDQQGRGGLSLLAHRVAAWLDSSWSVPCYNVGLKYKYMGGWEESLNWNRRAAMLAPDDMDAWWNLGIAATARRSWRIAREAWNHCGLEYDLTDEPVSPGIGTALVRLQAAGKEVDVVWVNRLDPARGLIENIPRPSSGFCFRDIVLHDGAPKGHRISGGVEYPVFDLLELWERSRHDTWQLSVSADHLDSVDLIESAILSPNMTIQCWTTTVRHLCRQCSEGTPHEAHDRELPGAIASIDFGIATDLPEISGRIAEAMEGTGIRDYSLGQVLVSNTR